MTVNQVLSTSSVSQETSGQGRDTGDIVGNKRVVARRSIYDLLVFELNGIHAAKDDLLATGEAFRILFWVEDIQRARDHCGKVCSFGSIEIGGRFFEIGA